MCNCGSTARTAVTGAKNLKWVLTTPDGQKQEYDTDRQAYEARAKKGGKVRAVMKS